VPASRFPQVALIAAWDDNLERRWRFAALGGRLLANPSGCSMASIRVTVSGREFTARADKSRSKPGYHLSHHLAKPLPTSTRQTDWETSNSSSAARSARRPRLLFRALPLQVVADGRERAVLLAFAVTKKGTPEPTLQVKGASCGAVTAGILRCSVAPQLTLGKREFVATTIELVRKERVRFVAGPPGSIRATAILDPNGRDWLVKASALR